MNIQIQRLGYISEILRKFDEMQGIAVEANSIAYDFKCRLPPKVNEVENRLSYPPGSVSEMGGGQVYCPQTLPKDLQRLFYNRVYGIFGWFQATRVLLPGRKDGTCITAIRESAADRLRSFGVVPNGSPYRQLVEHISTTVLQNGTLSDLRALKNLKPAGGNFIPSFSWKLGLLELCIKINKLAVTLYEYTIVQFAVGFAAYKLCWKVYELVVVLMPALIRESVLPHCAHFLMKHSPILLIKGINLAWVPVAWTVQHWFIAFAASVALELSYKLCQRVEERLLGRSDHPLCDRVVDWTLRLLSLPAEIAIKTFLFPVTVINIVITAVSGDWRDSLRGSFRYLTLQRRLERRRERAHLIQELSPLLLQYLTTRPQAE